MQHVALRVSALVLAVAFVASASPAEAQVTRPIKFGLGGGLTIPTGDVGDGFDTGYHGQLMLGFSVPMIPLGLRADGVYHSFSGSEGLGLDLKVLGGGVNVMYDLPGVMIRPFLSGGLGMYNVKFEADDPADEADETKFGFNLGGGFRFNLTGFDTFVEARYYSVQTSDEAANFIPITFGIMF
jgi:opacity protein-like surface antigen